MSFLSTAGAVPVPSSDKKGQFSMQKVKVNRYVAGKRPEFAEQDSSDSGQSSDEEDVKPILNTQPALEAQIDANDPNFKRLQRLRTVKADDSDSDDGRRHRRRERDIEEPEVIARRPERESSSDEEQKRRKPKRDRSPEQSDEDSDASDSEMERRRQMLRLKAHNRVKEEELLSRQQEDEEGGESDEAEYESDSEEEDDMALRLKPVFVRKRDRITLQDCEKEQQKLKDLELEQKKAAEERKRTSAKLAADLVKREVDMEKEKKDERLDLDAVNTDDENDELAYEAWKLRELKRIKRNKDDRDTIAREKAELDKIHKMTEEERRAWARANPRIITNKAEKGKYKFLQKYYHRGVFFLDNEDDVLKQNFAEPTLEDQFNKQILPNVMQVKDFGKAGRTKWTHLVNEDTTNFESPWASDTVNNLKFYSKHAGGGKDVFDRPAAKKRKN